MAALHTTWVTKRLVLIAFAALLFVACAGEATPESLPFADDPAGDSAEAGEITSGDEAPTSTSLFDIDSLEDEVEGPTTTQVPPPVPLEPTLVVECATNPRTVTLTFADEFEVPLEWELAVRRRPSGIDRATVLETLDEGTEVPEEPLVYEVVTNDLRFSVSAENASGSIGIEVDVDSYTGCPEAGSLQGRAVEQIDCVSGAFEFTPALGSEIVVDSVVVDRVSGTDVTLPVSANGLYRVPGWSGPEEVKAVVTFTDSLGIHTEHINHWCFGGPFGRDLGGDYKVCADDAVMLAYPREWVSAIDGEGSDCAFFRYRPNAGSTDSNVTLSSLGAVTLDEAAASLLPPGPWIIANEEAVNPSGFSDHIGTIAGGERIRFELAWDNAPSLVRRVVWLVDVEGIVWRLEANIQGLEEIDGMANSLQFLSQ
jgi:hypothetical protein